MFQSTRLREARRSQLLGFFQPIVFQSTRLREARHFRGSLANLP